MEDIFDIVIHDDETGEVLLHRKLSREDAEQAIINFDIVKDRPHMALIRAVLAAGLYSINGKSVSAQRVPAAVGLVDEEEG
jgi:predicted butyrate kinase (DUF1464 family)